MKLLIVASTAWAVSTACLAQSAPSQANMPNYSTYATSMSVYQQAADTPTMKRERLKRALALKREAAELALQDGGTMTQAHQRYVQRKADAILHPY